MGQNIKKYAIATFFAFLLLTGLFLYQNYSQAEKASSNTSKDNIAEPFMKPSRASKAEPQYQTIAATEKTVAPIETAAANCVYPSQILNLTSWKETLPTGSSNKPTEIKQAMLASYANPHFRPNSQCDGVIFRAPVNGVTTSGSGYPRSELREMTADGKSLASWATNIGTHTLFIDEAITAVPKTKKHVVAGQIHDADDDVVVIRLEYPNLFVDVNGKKGPILDSSYQLGKRFTVKFVAAAGQIKIYYNGNTAPAYTMNKTSGGNYFKAGAYTQSNCSKEKDCGNDNYGEVTIYKLSLEN